MVLVIFFRRSLSNVFSNNQMYGANPVRTLQYFFCTDQLHVSVNCGYHQAGQTEKINYIHNCVGAEISVYFFLPLMWPAWWWPYFVRKKASDFWTKYAVLTGCIPYRKQFVHISTSKCLHVLHVLISILFINSEKLTCCIFEGFF